MNNPNKIGLKSRASLGRANHYTTSLSSSPVLLDQKANEFFSNLNSLEDDEHDGFGTTTQPHINEQSIGVRRKDKNIIPLFQDEKEEEGKEESNNEQNQDEGGIQDPVGLEEEVLKDEIINNKKQFHGVKLNESLGRSLSTRSLGTLGRSMSARSLELESVGTVNSQMSLVDPSEEDIGSKKTEEEDIESLLKVINEPEKLPCSLIHPQANSKIKWDVFVSLLIIYSVIVIPFRIGFGVEAEGFAYGFDWFVDFIFFVDIVLSFLTGYWQGEDLVIDHHYIAIRYLKGWFIIDFLSTAPIDHFIAYLMTMGDDFNPAAQNDPLQTLRSIKLIKFFRLIRLLKLVRLLKLKKNGSSLEGVFSINPALQRLLKLLLQIVFVAHLLSCCWFFTTTFNETRETWVVRHRLIDSPVTDQYLASFYWTVATMMAVGYGDIYAVNDYERVYSILVQVTGATAFGFIIANIAAFLETFDPRASAYRQRMDSLKQYMRDRNLSRPLQKRIRKYYDYILSKESIFDDSRILSQLPSQLTETLILHIHGAKAKKIDFLREEDSSFVAYIMARAKVLLALSGEILIEQQSVTTDIYMIVEGKVEGLVMEYVSTKPTVKELAKTLQSSHSRSSIKKSSMSSQTKERARKDPKVHSNSLANTNLERSIKTGSLKKVTTKDSRRQSTIRSRIGKSIKDSIVCGVYLKGANFGEVGVLRNEPHKITYRANKACDLLSISKEHIEYAIYMYPTSALRFRKRADKHGDLMDQSIASDCKFFETTERRIKMKVTLDGSRIISPDEVNASIGKISASALIVSDVVGRLEHCNSKGGKSTRSLGSTDDNDFDKTLRTGAMHRNSIRVKRASFQASKEEHEELLKQPQLLSTLTQNKLMTTVSQRKLNLVFPSEDEEEEDDEDKLPINDRTKRKPGMSLQALRFRNQKSVRTGSRGREHGTKDVEMDVRYILKKLWIIPPGNSLKIKWDLGIALFIVYSVVIVPYRIGFQQPATGIFEIFDWAVDIFFFLDMVVTFRTAYEDSMEDIVIIVPSLIAKNYLKGWFTVDFLSTFPFDSVITFFISSANPEALRSIKLIKVFRMIRLLKLARLFKLKKLMGDLDTEIEIGPGFMKLVSLLFQISFVAHLFACFWFYSSTSGGDDPRSYFFHELGYSPDTDVDVLKKYIASIYWSFTTMTTVGYGDIAPTSSAERLYSIFIMIMGATIFGYVVGSIASLISMLDIAEALYKSKMSELDEFLAEQGIPKALRTECKACFSYSLSLCSVFDEKSLLERLSPALRQEVLISIHFQAVQVIPIFKNETVSFVADMIQVMDPQLALSNTFVINNGDIGANIYFIVGGEVRVYDGDWPEPRKDGTFDFDKKKLHRLSVGQFFGHEAVLSGKRHNISVKTTKITQLYVLSKASIGNLVDSVPPFAILLQGAMRRAIKKQDIQLGKATPEGGVKKLWSLVQNRFSDILSLSPSRMKRLSAEAQSSGALEKMLFALINSGKEGGKQPSLATGILTAVKKAKAQENTLSDAPVKSPHEK